jgi:hypothetical protein
MLARGHWPQACPPELREHLAVCPSCAELVLVAQAFQHSRAHAAAQARLPAPGAIWWRAQLRRRNAAVERVGKPIFGAYVFALAVTLMAAAAVAISQLRHGLQWLDFTGQSQIADRIQGFNPVPVLNPGSGLIVLIPVFAALALLGAVVVYLAGERQ